MGGGIGMGNTCKPMADSFQCMTKPTTTTTTTTTKESAYDVGDLGSIPGLGRFPGGGRGNPLQYSCLENPHGQRSLADYSPWDLKESDSTE